ncbi:hypothetical protein ALC60_09179 [Trachymyrmex zeteki]|uniref:Uncharacterized protein n=1 Tax=Mycetomoellerius zeteki TaxID=64791 RepID=A0A151WVI8_9HYME|nr:hypothetical protein ALC60_09179 [Trachymyrmex zeteki]
MSHYSLKMERSLWFPLNFEVLVNSLIREIVRRSSTKGISDTCCIHVIIEVRQFRSIYTRALDKKFWDILYIQFKFRIKGCIIYPFNKHNCESWSPNVVQRPARSCIRFLSSFN